MNTSSAPHRLNPTVVIAVYLAFAAGLARTLASPESRGLWPWYVGLHLAYLILFTVVLWRPGLPSGLLHLYFVAQSLITLVMLSLRPELDFVTTLFILPCYQAALVFTGSTRWKWVAILVLLTGGSLMFYMGPLRGLALGLTSMAVGIVLPSFVAANQEIE